MSVSEDLEFAASSDSFWEIGQYKRTVKRVDDGHKQCGKLIDLIEDRCRIEQEYAKKLEEHSKQWKTRLEKGPEYGTMEAAMKSLLDEAESVCNERLQVRESLQSEVVTAIKTWQKENYKTQVMAGKTKQAKEMEDQFRKAQKQWAKLLDKVNKTKADFHKACKLERSATLQEQNARNDSSQSQDHLAKLQREVEKCQEATAKTRDRYQSAIKDIDAYNPKYMEDMQSVFDKCQDMEKKRLSFFKEMLCGIHKCLVDSQNLQQIAQNLYQGIQMADYTKDLKWWSLNHGTDMAMNWPMFEEYSPEATSITRKEKRVAAGAAGAEDGVTLSNVRKTAAASAVPGPGADNSHAPAARSSVVQPEPTSTDRKDAEEQPFDRPVSESGMMMQANGKNTLSSTSSNPYEDEEDTWDEYGEDAGVSVRALYDYQGTEDDELTFRQGEVFTKLEDEDDQGWCKGRLDGKIGLYPANYVEPV